MEFKTISVASLDMKTFLNAYRFNKPSMQTCKV